MPSVVRIVTVVIPLTYPVPSCFDRHAWIEICGLHRRHMLVFASSILHEYKSLCLEQCDLFLQFLDELGLVIVLSFELSDERG